jgi:hypothetical protein
MWHDVNTSDGTAPPRPLTFGAARIWPSRGVSDLAEQARRIRGVLSDRSSTRAAYADQEVS